MHLEAREQPWVLFLTAAVHLDFLRQGVSVGPETCCLDGLASQPAPVSLFLASIVLEAEAHTTGPGSLWSIYGGSHLPNPFLVF